MRAGARRLVLVGLVAVGCEHSAPFDVPAAEPRGPFDLTLPRRLTFNTGDDRAPMVFADTIVFSRVDLGRQDGDGCLGFLPLEGGVLARSECPGGPLADDRQQLWSEPVVSPDGARIAYLVREGPIGAASRASQRIVVAPLVSPGLPTATYSGRVTLGDGREAAEIRRLRWVDDATLRFLVGAPDPITNAFTPFAVADLGLASGLTVAVPGVSEPSAYANAPDGGVWYASRADPSLLLHVPPDGDMPVAVGRFNGAVVDVENGNGVPVAATAVATVEWLDPGTGAFGGLLWMGGMPIQVASAPVPGRVVAEIFAEGGADLWLLEIVGAN